MNLMLSNLENNSGVRVSAESSNNGLPFGIRNDSGESEIKVDSMTLLTYTLPTKISIV